MFGDRLTFRVHAVRRMFDRGSAAGAVTEALRRGEVIEDYPNDTPYPSRLRAAATGVRVEIRSYAAA